MPGSLGTEAGAGGGDLCAPRLSVRSATALVDGLRRLASSAASRALTTRRCARRSAAASTAKPSMTCAKPTGSPQPERAPRSRGELRRQPRAQRAPRGACGMAARPLARAASRADSSRVEPRARAWRCWGMGSQPRKLSYIYVLYVEPRSRVWRCCSMTARIARRKRARPQLRQLN